MSVATTTTTKRLLMKRVLTVLYTPNELANLDGVDEQNLPLKNHISSLRLACTSATSASEKIENQTAPPVSHQRSAMQRRI